MTKLNKQLLTFGKWCDIHSFNPNDDDNFSLYLYWLQKETNKFRKRDEQVINDTEQTVKNC